MPYPILDGTVVTERHTTFYHESGPKDGTPIILVHGWPELAISWRHQIPVLAELGFRVIAPDMRGYGRSTSHPRCEDYTMEQNVGKKIKNVSKTIAYEHKADYNVKFQVRHL